MTDREAIDRVLRARGACPICEEKGATYLAPLHALRGHLSKEHTVDQLVYQIAGEAVLSALEDEQERKEEVEDPPKLATGGLLKGPGALVSDQSGCVFPIAAEMVRASNPSPAIDPQTIADAVNVINANDYESFPPKDPAATEFEAKLRRAIKDSD